MIIDPQWIVNLLSPSWTNNPHVSGLTNQTSMTKGSITERNMALLQTFIGEVSNSQELYLGVFAAVDTVGSCSIRISFPVLS
jgi:hypothetical protein